MHDVGRLQLRDSDSSYLLLLFHPVGHYVSPVLLGFGAMNWPGICTFTGVQSHRPLEIHSMCFTVAFWAWSSLKFWAFPTVNQPLARDSRTVFDMQK